MNKIHSRIFITDYNTAWQAVLDSLKTYDREVVNRQAGVVQTSWLDNTTHKNFTDSFGDSDTYLKTRFKLNLTVAPGNYNGKPSVKVSIHKDQQVQTGMLEHWKNVPSDQVDENTILYRIGRIIFLKMRVKQIEDDKAAQALEQGT